MRDEFKVLEEREKGSEVDKTLEASLTLFDLFPRIMKLKEIETTILVTKARPLSHFACSFFYSTSIQDEKRMGRIANTNREYGGKCQYDTLNEWEEQWELPHFTG